MIQHPVGLLAFLLAVVAVSRALEARFASVEKISSAVVCTLLGIALSNLGVIPHESGVYEAVNSYAIPYAIVLVILASDLAELRTAGAPMLAAFGLAVAGSFAGGLAAAGLFGDALGPDTWKLSGQFAGSFVGGGMNFVAVGRGLETEPGLFAAAAVVNNLSTVPWMLTQIAAYRWLAPYYHPARTGHERGGTGGEGSAPGADDARLVRERWGQSTVTVTDLSVIGALPLAAVWAAERLAPLLPGFPQVLWLTTLALVAAQIRFFKRFNGSAMLSYFALHLFFVVIGTSAVFSAVVRAGPMLFVFMIVVIAVHAATVYGLGRLVRLELETITIASQAAVGGPGSALALSMSMRWPSLVMPGIIVGIFGYALGNYLGFACAYLARSLIR
jgi:uncharacterized membrane protein